MPQKASREVTLLSSAAHHNDGRDDNFLWALGYPRPFFYEDDADPIEVGAASFRSLTSMSARERDAALAAGSLAYELIDWVAEKFSLPEPDIIDLGQERDPASAARMLRQYWAIGEKPIGNMIKLLESKGVRVFSLAEDSKNVDAFSCWRDNQPFVFLNTFKSTERKRTLVPATPRVRAKGLSTWTSAASTPGKARQRSASRWAKVSIRGIWTRANSSAAWTTLR